MSLDVQRPRMCLLWLLVCGWVAFSKATYHPCIYAKIDAQTLQAIAKTSLTESHILEELAEAATKNQGGNKAIKGIKGLKVQGIRPPNITISFHPEKGICLLVASEVTIAGKSFIGGTMEITLRSKMKTESTLKVSLEKHLIFEVNKCGVELLSCKTNLPSSMLPKIVNKFLNSTLAKVLPGMMCPAADKVVSIMAVRIEDMFVVNEIGDHGTMQYVLDGLPDLDGEWIGLCLRPIFYDKDGKEKEISNEPPLSDNLPEKKEGSTEIILPVNILDAMMELFTDDFSCEITGADSSLLTVNKLAEILPSIKDTLPPSGKVKVEIRPEEPPRFSLAEGKSSLVIFSKIDILIHDTGMSVLSFQMTHEWLTKFAVEDEKLKIEAYGVRTSDVRDFSLSVDEADVEALKGYMEDIVSGVCLPNVNKIMADNKMALPNMMGSTYSECETSITSVKDALAFDVTPKDLPMDLVALADKFSHFQKKHHY